VGIAPRRRTKEKAMTHAHMPPVPPANQPKHGGPTQDPKKSDIKAETIDRDVKQGKSGDIKQNTTHQGYQQDR
jgi:hypothetical protein